MSQLRFFLWREWRVFLFPHYQNWLEDVLSWCRHLLDATQFFNGVLFTYDYDKNLMKAFCECQSLLSNTLHTSVGEISITPQDLSILGGLSCTGVFYDEVVQNTQLLDGTNKQGQPYLPYSCHYLFMAYHHLQNRLKRQGKVSIHDMERGNISWKIYSFCKIVSTNSFPPLFLTMFNSAS